MKIKADTKIRHDYLAEIPSQDNEGFRPDPMGFHTGWKAAERWANENFEFYDPKDAVEVYRFEKGSTWYEDKDSGDFESALLINRCPIAKETAEDVLRDIVRALGDRDGMTLRSSRDLGLFDRARKVLGDE